MPQDQRRKVVKRKFEDHHGDQEDTGATPARHCDEDAAADAAADAATPTTPPHGGAAAAAGCQGSLSRRLPGHRPPALPVALPPAQGSRWQGVVGRMLELTSVAKRVVDSERPAAAVIRVAGLSKLSS